MPNLFDPVAHVDGQQYSAADVNRLENGLDAVDTELDAQTDRIDALYASGGAGGGVGQQLSGPSSARPAPALGTVYLDTDLGRYIGGFGTSWRNLDGTALTDTGGGQVPGTSTAPANMTATVTAGGTIGQINMTWLAVPGAAFYTLYESASPTGVAGSTAMTTTSVSRTPNTARNYEYWVRATVNGVESADSNHVTAILPYVAPGGTPPVSTTDPSTLLNINGKGTGAGGWWNLGIGYSTGHVDITPTQLQNGFVDSPYYVVNAAGTGVQMQTFMNGGKTSANTKYSRCELREYATGSTTTKASWNGTTGRHRLGGKTKVLHYAPIKCETVVGQIHDAAQDALQIRAEAASATGTQTWRLSIFGVEVRDLISVALGTEVSWEIDVNAGALTVRINGTSVYTDPSPGFASTGNYFKAGEYVQQNSTDQANSATEYGRAELRDLFVIHS